MPGIATQFEILRLTIERLENSGNQQLSEIAQVMKDNPQFAHLGAIGAGLGDFLPADPVPEGKDPFNDDPNPYALAWKILLGLIAGQKGYFAALSKIRAILDKMDQIAKDEDCDKLKALQEGTDPDFSLDDIETSAADLDALINRTMIDVPVIAGVIAGRMRPNVCTPATNDPVPPPEAWQPRDFLHWKGSGRFVQALLKKAATSGDQRLQAYAYGFTISYSADVCGQPAVNSAVGGPSRTQWWRQRFVKNYTDAWVFGFYNQVPRPTMTGDTPSPDYSTWPSLCDANLQKRIELSALDPKDLLERVRSADPFPKVLPDDFAQLWFEAFQDAYNAPLPPTVKPEALNGAYLMTWLMLWLQTSGSVLGCNLKQPVQPPDGCGEDPSELDPFVPAAGGGPSAPPTLDPDLEDTAAIVCGIILAILGGVALLAGGLAAGAALIAGAAALLDCSSVVEWQKLRCQLYWFRMYLYNADKGFHKLLAVAGFGYPEPASLKEDEEVIALIPEIQFESGRNLVKSRVTKEDFPSKPWATPETGAPLWLELNLLRFNQRPTNANPGFESPQTLAYLSEVYPSFYVDDDAANPLANGDVKTGGAFPVREQGAPGSGRPVQFGNAVANAVDLFANLAKEFPDWNLDADRGLAYLTWEFDGTYNPDAVQIKPEP